VDNTKIIISKADLAQVGLDQYPSDLGALFFAIFLNALYWFQGDLVDNQGRILINNLGESIGYNYGRLAEELNLSFETKYFYNNRIYQRFHVRFFSG
jgi:hypothetical protein